MFKNYKEYFEDHKDNAKAIAITVGITSFLFLSGCAIGARHTDASWRRAITCCCLANPELKAVLKDAARKALEIGMV